MAKPIHLVWLMLAGCGGSESVFEVSTDNTLVNDLLPKIRQACPGLDAYSSEFVNIRVQDNYRTTIAFDIPQSAKLPPYFMAEGHSCYVEIGGDGAEVFVEKGACKSVCLNRSQVPEGQLVLPLH